MRYIFLSLLFLSACSSNPKVELMTDMVPECAKVGIEGAKELRAICTEEKCKALTDFFNRHAKVCDILKNRRELYENAK